VLRILSPILISGLLGWLVIRLFFRPVGVWQRTAFYLALGIPIGSGLFAMCSFLTFLAAKPGTASILAAFCIPAALAAFAGWLQATGRIFRPVPLGSVAIGPSTVVTMLCILCLVTCLAAALLLLGYFLGYPHGMWDAHAMWNARARVMFRAPEFWRDVFLPDHFHPDYPLSLSILVFTGWTALGRETQTVPFALAVVFLFVAAAIVAVGITIWKNLAWGLVAGSLILCSIGYVSLAGAQYADVPLSAFFAVCLVLFTLAYRDRKVHVPVLTLTGAVAAWCGWIKNEGTPIVFGLTLGLLLACILFRRAREWFREAGWFWLGATPVVAMLQYYRSLAPANDIVQGLASGTVQQKLLDAHRWATIVKRYGEAWWNAPGTIVPLILILVFALVAAGIRVEPNLRLPLITGFCALGVVAATHVGAYLVTPNALAWHLDTSVNRLALQLMPSMVFLSMALVRRDFLELRSTKEEPGETGTNDGAVLVSALPDSSPVGPEPGASQRQII
jgi:hypothetical protein